MKFFLLFLTIFLCVARCVGQTIQTSGPTAFCEGGSVTLSVNDAPGGSTFRWTRNDTVITGATNSSYVARVSGKYSVIVTSAGVPVTYDPVSVTVYSKPVVIIAAVDSACSGTPVQFNPTVTGGTPPYRYAWTFGGGGTSVLPNPAHAFTSIGCGNAFFTTSLVVTDTNGCIAVVATKQIRIKMAPNVQLQDVNIFSPFKNCNNNPTPASPNFSLTVKNISPDSSCISTYSVDWGDGSPVKTGLTSAGFPLEYTYKKIGAFNLVVTAFGKNGCSNSKTYLVANQSNPDVGLGSFGPTEGCAPLTVNIVITTWQNNSDGTTYLLEYGDDSSKIFTHPINPKYTDDTSLHIYTTSSCPGTTGFHQKITVTNACKSKSYEGNDVQAKTPPVADFSISSNPSCAGKPVTFTNKTKAGYYNDCSTTTETLWNFGDPSSGSNNTSSRLNESHTYSTPGTYTVTLTSSNPCRSSTDTQQICIIPPPKASFRIADSSGCAPFTVRPQNISDTSTCATSVFKWDLQSYTPSNCGTFQAFTFAPGSSPSSTNPVIVFTNAGTYVLRLTITSSCGTYTDTKIITVKKKPTLSFAADTTVCGPVTFTPKPVIPACETGISAYAWSFAGGNLPTSSLPNPGPVTFSDTGRHLISLKTTNACGDTTVTRQVIIISPPTLGVPRDTALCAGSASGSFNFSSSSTGVTYSWTNNNTSIGLVASGTGNIGNFVLRNTGTQPVIATIRVTASKSGCTSPVDSFHITVYPVPAAPGATSSVSYCQGDSAEPLPVSPAAGHILIWYATATGGTGTTTAPKPVTTALGSTNYYVSQKNTATGCESGRSQIMVTVKALSVIGSSSFVDPSSCGASDGRIILNGLAANTSYAVAYTKNGGVPVTISIVATGAGVVTITGLTAGRYTNVHVTPANGCSSNTAGPFTLSDPNPPAAPAASGNRSLCSGGTLSLKATTSASGPVFYSWTGPNGFISSVQNPDIANATEAASGTYYVTVKINGCSSLSDSITVVVSPKPAAPVARSNSPVCSGTALELKADSISSGSMSYAWTGPNNFTSTLQNPVISNASAANNGIYTVTATDTKTGCTSSSGSTTATINTTPIISSSFTNPTGCDSSNGTITVSGLLPSTTYSLRYGKDGVAQGPATVVSNASGNIILTRLPAGAYSNIIITLGNCSSNTISQIILQGNPSFKITAQSDSLVCAGTSITLKVFTTPARTANYIWTGPNGFTSNMQNPVVASATTANSGLYRVTATVNGCSASDSVAVGVVPVPAGGTTGPDAEVCAGTNAGTITLTGYTGNVVSWESTANNGITWSKISNTRSSLDYKNLFSTTLFRASVQTATCPAVYSTVTKITVNQPVQPVFFEPPLTSTCNHDTIMVFTAKTTNPGNNSFSYRWYINNQLQGISNPFSYRFTAPLNSPASTEFIVKLMADNTAGCGDTSFTGRVLIRPLPVAAIKVSPSLVQYQPDYTFTFQDTSAGGPNKIYSWIMGDRSSQAGIGRQITYEFGNTGTYKVKLFVTDFNTSCKAADSVSITIIPLSGSLYVPNAFYPNSSKHELTSFKLIGTGLEKFHLQIFDTWGKLVFETSELNADGSPKISWNGTYFNRGAAMPHDAYVWRITEAKFRNGKHWEGMSVNGSSPKRFGTVTLFR